MTMMTNTERAGIGSAARAAIGLDSWLIHPNGKFSFLNAAEFVPSSLILPASPPETRPRQMEKLAGAKVSLSDGSVMSVDAMIEHLEVDSLIVSRGDQIVVETHAGHVDPRRPHLLFSVSKSITGLLAGIAVGDRALSAADRVGRWVPELARSGFADATVRDLLDMTVDLTFNEDYADPASDFNRYRRAILWAESPSPRDTMLGVLSGVPAGPDGHGRRFRYISCVTDVLGLVVELAMGRRYVDLLRDRLTVRLGCSDPVTMAVDAEGHARATGGVSMSARDLLGVGQLVAARGRGADGTQVVPAEWIDDLTAGVTRQAWVDGEFPDMLPQGSYRSCWYDIAGGGGGIAALGIFGQFVFVDPARDIVVVCLSSRPVMSDPALSSQGLSLMRQIADEIAGQDLSR